MRLSVETRDKLRDMGAGDLLAALEAQDEALCGNVQFLAHFDSGIASR